MSAPLILEFFEELQTTGDMNRYAQQVAERYLEGTLQRLLAQRQPRIREAALTALRLVGTMASNSCVAGRLRDPVRPLRELAESALWAIWFRGDDPEQGRELQQLSRLVAERDFETAIKGLDSLIRRAPRFAEAYNQRAIAYWRSNDFRRAILDCERAVRLNPCHFGALSGMAQCYLSLNRPVEALRHFRQAHRINPNMEGLLESIRALEQFLREERRRRRDNP
ncbi:MAG: tetratricopeptide repeat protein [Gemmatales bacterium]|nr:tetratricopeptide repeat protein [Gemmatales bacterium]MDW8387954.1 tetratricopeptide repeat protein [Gemmatales bacterium]